MGRSVSFARQPRPEGQKRAGGSQLDMVTFNGSCWTTAKALIEETRAQVVFVQEVRLDQQQCLEAKDALKKKGWKVFVSAARRTGRGGLSAGVAMVCRAWLDVWQCEEQFGDQVVPGRCIHAFLWTRKAGS